MAHPRPTAAHVGLVGEPVIVQAVEHFVWRLHRDAAAPVFYPGVHPLKLMAELFGGIEALYGRFRSFQIRREAAHEFGLRALPGREGQLRLYGEAQLFRHAALAHAPAVPERPGCVHAAVSAYERVFGGLPGRDRRGAGGIESELPVFAVKRVVKLKSEPVKLIPLKARGGVVALALVNAVQVVVRVGDEHKRARLARKVDYLHFARFLAGQPVAFLRHEQRPAAEYPVLFQLDQRGARAVDAAVGSAFFLLRQSPQVPARIAVHDIHAPVFHREYAPAQVVLQKAFAHPRLGSEAHVVVREKVVVPVAGSKGSVYLKRFPPVDIAAVRRVVTHKTDLPLGLVLLFGFII